MSTEQNKETGQAIEAEPFFRLDPEGVKADIWWKAFGVESDARMKELAASMAKIIGEYALKIRLDKDANNNNEFEATLNKCFALCRTKGELAMIAYELGALSM